MLRFYARKNTYKFYFTIAFMKSLSQFIQIPSDIDTV